MKQTLLVLLLSGVLYGTAPAQTKLTAPLPHQQLSVAKNPEAVGVSPERLRRLDAALKAIVDDGKVPGLVAILVRNGQIVYHQAYGLADVATQRPQRTDDIFRIASMTKAITATAVMMLYEEGKFALDDPISRYIPEFKNPKVLKSFSFADSSYTTERAGSEITIRQLLTHTSGLGYGVIDGDERFRAMYHKAGITDLFTTAPVRIGESVRKLAALPLHHQPGEKYVYSEGLDVLGYFIEVVSGQPFDVFLRTRLFEPLGLKDTHFYLPEAQRARLVPIQKPDSARKWVPYPVTFYDPNYPATGAKTFFSGGAGLSSTARDYAVFLQMLVNGGTYNGQRFLSRYTTELLTVSNQTGTLYGGEAGYMHFSLGFSVVTPKGQDRGLGRAGKFNWGGYFNTNYFADPQEKIVAVLMKQTRDVSGDTSEATFIRMIYQTLDN
ncbi:serine hydrolase domain-containing protein [Rhabdobacter roseus]|uniref:CubicO group peptidase (Beta-lactamase class C family) n=1 Tax=Rhabdobacter roseus TaxID=1655419 RepID=A0A840TYC0_9BACT|nr:serine hydrolase domain-containing protein [Rhabdobacter roseus]MBB5286557.1 CubicO group peptidase (beta-lactamase class C family) [Rhabdobacter roseus]